MWGMCRKRSEPQFLPVKQKKGYPLVHIKLHMRVPMVATVTPGSAPTLA